MLTDHIDVATLHTSTLFLATHRALTAGRYVEASELIGHLINRTDASTVMLLEPLGSYIAHNGQPVRGNRAINLHKDITAFNARVRRSTWPPTDKGVL